MWFLSRQFRSKWKSQSFAEATQISDDMSKKGSRWYIFSFHSSFYNPKDFSFFSLYKNPWDKISAWKRLLNLWNPSKGITLYHCSHGYIVWQPAMSTSLLWSFFLVFLLILSENLLYCRFHSLVIYVFVYLMLCIIIRKMFTIK